MCTFIFNLGGDDKSAVWTESQSSWAECCSVELAGKTNNSCIGPHDISDLLRGNYWEDNEIYRAT